MVGAAIFSLFHLFTLSLLGVRESSSRQIIVKQNCIWKIVVSSLQDVRCIE
ncbi:hypothetical protein HMPREF0670_01989 [Prevotella sp. oral taxon 317 str. F0108]|nr:hypothetical protein HMPREF0670_01989 [Prevotella sp. oral taxon 317 str. F0108]